MTSDPATIVPPVQTHACVRCGAQTALDRGLCENCNPIGLKDSASSQVHGTVFLGVLVAVLALAAIGRLAVSGVGPFPVEIAAVKTDGAGLAVTLVVTNSGTSTGQTTCRLTDTSPRSSGYAAILLSPRIEPGQRVSFTRQVTEFGPEVRELAIECSSP